MFGFLQPSPDRLLRDRVRSRVVVTLRDGSAFAGVLLDADATCLVLRDAEALGVGEKRGHVAVDGEVLVLLAEVLYLQRP